MNLQISLSQPKQFNGWQSLGLSVLWHLMLLALLPLWLAELSLTKSPEEIPTIVHFIEILSIPEAEPPPQKLVKEQSEIPKPVAPVISKPLQQTTSTETSQSVPVALNMPPANPSAQPVESASDEVAWSVTTSPIANPEGIATEVVSHANATPDLKQISSVVSSEPIEAKPKVASVIEDLRGVEESFASLVREMIAAAKTYPASAKKREFEGKVLIAFTLSKNGRVIDLAINASSGYETLDNAALQAVRNAGPFPPIPEKLGRETIVFNLPISFSLR